jgi:hypothetical protein
MNRKLVVVVLHPLSIQTPRATSPSTALDYMALHFLQERILAQTATFTILLTKELRISLSFLQKPTSMLLIKLSYQISLPS